MGERSEYEVGRFSLPTFFYVSISEMIRRSAKASIASPTQGAPKMTRAS